MARHYLAPFVLYVLGTNVAALLPQTYYPWAYTLVVILVGSVILDAARREKLFAPHGRVLAALGVGLLGIALWIGLGELQPEQWLTPFLPAWLHPQSRPAYNPFQAIPSTSLAWSFVAVRCVGLVVLVPVAEELFWRGFLLRWLISEDWRNVPLGRFSWPSFAIVTFAFTAAHPEWAAAAIYCMLLNGLLYWKKDLWNCIVAHAVSNLTLAAYVLSTSAWELW